MFTAEKSASSPQGRYQSAIGPDGLTVNFTVLPHRAITAVKVTHDKLPYSVCLDSIPQLPS
jgi:hypothetical protein